MSEALLIAPADQRALDQGQAALTEATYHGWLRSLPPEQVIGHPRRAAHCPLGRFLFAQTGRRWLIDGRRAYLIDTLAYAPGIVLPAWAERQAFLVDTHGAEVVTVHDGLARCNGGC